MRANRSIGAAIAFLLAVSLTSAAGAQATGEVAGAGGAPFPAGTTLNLITVRALQFGVGAAATFPGGGTGDLHVTLLGTSVLGESRVITFDGEIATVSLVDGAATLGGTGTLDMGDGTVPSLGVLFTASATANTFRLVLGGTTLPQVLLSEGTITIK